ncbi:hypothetical protein CFK38_07660 [Brachybacterium vulturis]|uniref:Uncharacterized protein n=1 Tax=Brachybacterium vulturis TaxID=2017484 RepID=A0A291GN05_9MICO|nr:hypothetical protein [Brachybacterium vulturis]ATG51416.1 hypothetical protein CFK38_07660 [Brachybacterium vulturis]
MTIGYRSILQLDDREDALRVAEVQLRGWLTDKARKGNSGLETTEWEGEGEHHLGPRNTLTVVEHVSNGDNLRRASLEYVEENSHGIWTTRVYAMSNPDSRKYRQVLWFESEGERANNGTPLKPATPRIVRNTLETNEARDASVPILAGPRTTRGDDTDELLGYIEDAHRNISIVVAAPIPGVDSESWARAVDSLTRDTLGCASFFVLDADAHTRLNEQLGQAHAIPAGAIRTFTPQVDLTDPADARRHRMLTAQTILTGLGDHLKFDERTKRLVSITPRLSLLERDLPAELTRTVRILQRQQIAAAETPTVEQAPHQSPTAVAEPSITAEAPQRDTEPTTLPETRAPWYEGLRALIQRIVGRDKVDEQALQTIAERFDRNETAARTSAAMATKLQVERERLEDRVTDLKQRLEAEQFERAITEEDRQAAEKKTRALELWRSEREDRFEFVETPNELWETDPVNVMAIIERLTGGSEFSEVRKHVTLTDPTRAIDDADAIDAIDKSSLYATSFWEYVLVLRDYAIAVDEQGFEGNVHMYLKSDAARGRKCPGQRHRANESQTVQNNKKLRRERTFPVPKSLDPSGQLFMATHFAPTHRDQNAPRLYYAVGKEGPTTRAYIGYMGVHLTNTKTN